MSDACPYCGNNPTSHIGAKSTAILNDVLSPLERHMPPAAVRFFSAIAQRSLEGTILLLHASGAASYVSDISTVTSDRGRVLWEEASRRGIRMEAIRAFGKQAEAFRAQVKGRTIYFVSLPRPLTNPTASDRWLDDKAYLKRFLSAAGIPVPKGREFTRFAPMLRYFDELEKPVIVKPRIGSRGRHTTTHVRTPEELRQAYGVAKKLSRSVVVEEHLFGSVYRATMIDGELIGVLEGMPPRVVGDGVSTIRELVEKKNAMRDAKVSAVELDERHREFLARLGYTFDSVPANGESVDLLEKIGVSYGGSSRELISSTHPETKRILTEAARVLGDPIIGFDFIIPDIERSPHDQKWGIIECNSMPFINLHHDPVEGEPINAAARLWDYVEGHVGNF